MEKRIIVFLLPILLLSGCATNNVVKNNNADNPNQIILYKDVSEYETDKMKVSVSRLGSSYERPHNEGDVFVSLNIQNKSSSKLDYSLEIKGISFFDYDYYYPTTMVESSGEGTNDETFKYYYILLLFS